MWSTKLPFRPPRPRPFFDLPWDIREQIYSYIELDAPPPLSNGSEYAGFVLSCKLAAEELSYVATQYYRHYLDEFKRSSKRHTGYTSMIVLPEQAPTGQTNPFAHLRQVKVEVRLRSGLGGSALSSKMVFTAALCDMFHPLFGLFLERVNIHFVSPFNPEKRVSRGCTNELYSIHQMIHRAFDLIETMNSQVEARTPYSRGQSLRLENDIDHFLYKFEAQVRGFTRWARVNTKAICFSWDCRPVGHIGSPPDMMGSLWSQTLRLRDSVGTDKQTHYRVHDAEGEAGEIRIASSSRWAPTSVGLPKFLFERHNKAAALQMKNLNFGDAAMIVGKVEM